MLGAFLAIVVQLTGVSALAFAVGVYLPLSTTAPIFVGGLVRYIVDRSRRMTPEESDSSPAVLMSSGLIAGGSIAGILIALAAVFVPTQDYFSTDDLPPIAQAQAADIRGEKAGPVGKTYSLFVLNDPGAYKLDASEAGEYLLDASGKPAYRVESGSIFDASLRFYPRSFHSANWPALVAFAVLISALLWAGLRGKPAQEEFGELPGADLAREREISAGDTDAS